jgi:RHS repeat-associated protein
MSAASVWGVLQLLLLTWPVRTVRWPTVLLAFGVGVYGCGVASLLVELTVARQLATARHESLSRVMDTVSWTTAPVAEELLKIAPLLIAGWALRRRMQWGLSDFAVLGGAVGAGFGLLESVLQYATSGDKAVRVPDEGGWRIPVKLVGQPYVPGPAQILGHWFPAATGTLDNGQAAMPYAMHVTTSVLGGLGVGLLCCGARWTTRVAGLLPAAGAVATHWVYNYAAVFANSTSADEWRKRLDERWGLWIVLGSLAFAWAWDLRRGRTGRTHEPGARLAAERGGQTASQALLGYSLLRFPATWITALGYARRRRALLYAAAHPRTDPQRLDALRESVSEQTARIDITHSGDAWRGMSSWQMWRRSRAQRTTWPWHEKLLLAGTALLAVPSLLYLAVGSFPATRHLQEYFAEGTGLRLLVGAALAGLALTLWRLASAAYGYRVAAAQPLGEATALVQFRIAVCAGSLVVGALLLYRWDALAGGANPLEPYKTLGLEGFLLEKLLRVGLPLLLTVALFAMPYALPLELLMSGGLAEGLLWAAAPRVLVPAAERLGARLALREAERLAARQAERLAEREALAWARGTRAARGAHTRTPELVRSGHTDPVDLATGRMFLHQTDVELPGALPLVLSRRADSGHRAGRWFGPTWSSTFDERLGWDDQGVVLFTEGGLVLSYPTPGASDAPVLPEDGPRHPLIRHAEGGWTVTDPDTGRARHFTPEGRLTRISDRAGRWISFAYDTEGAPSDVVHHGGYRIRVRTEGARIAALHLAVDDDWQELIRYGYDAEGHLAHIWRPSSPTPLRLTYDEAGRIASWTDTNSHAYAYTYDAQDRVTAEGGNAGHLAFALSYEGTHPDFPGHRVTTVTAPDTTATRYVIDDRHRVTAEIDANGSATRTVHDADGRVLAVTDALNRTTGHRYDEAGRLTAVLRPDGSEITVTYDPRSVHAEPSTVTDPGGGVWRQTYDTAGHRTSVTDPTGATTRFTYDAAGQLLAVSDPLGVTTRVSCNAAGLPVEITDPLGATTRYARDAFGRVTAETDPLGATTRYAWTPDGSGARPTRRTAPDGASETWDWDGEGNCTTHTDAMGAVTRYEYTHFDLLAARTGPDGVRYTFDHDTELHLRKVTNPQGLTWSYEYDAAGRLVAETDFDDRAVAYEHDAAGQLTARTTASGQTIRFRRDVLGRVVRKDAAGTVTTYTYDTMGRLAQAASPDAVLQLQRDVAGRLLSETVNGRTLTYTYDTLGRRTGRTTPTGATSTWAYDAAGNRTELTTCGHTLTFTHDAAGRETTRRIGELVTLENSFDPLGRLTKQELTGPADQRLQHRAYTYRADGNLTAIDDHLGGTRHFGLDPAGRVTAVQAANWTESYVYDTAGNQTHATWPASMPGQEATGDRAYTGTRITRAGSVRYEHDEAGRITVRQKPRLSRKPDTWRYTWDAEDRLTAVVTPDSTTWRYRYDPLGRRIAKERLATDGETVLEQMDFTWDGTTLAEQTTYSPGTDQPTITLTWDHNGLHPLTQNERKAAAADAPQEEIDSRFYAIVTDLIGTPTELVDEQGDIAWRTRTTLWGTTTWNRTATAYTPLRFPGQYFDPETGLHYNYFRHYDPETARYLTSDPLGLEAAPNPLKYVHNPHVSTDHLGLAPDCLPGDLPREPSVKNGPFAVIGRDWDTDIAMDWEGHEVLYIKEWSPVKNDAWIQKVIGERRDIYIASPVTPASLIGRRGGPSVFSRELDQLRDAGYIRHGDYLLAPHP